MKRDRPDDFDARDLLQLADLLHREVGITRRSAVKPDGTIRALALISDAIPIRSISCAKKMPLAPIREYATRAPSSVARSAGSVAMSGWSAPAFTAMPT